MRRADRLFRIIQALRGARRPVTARALADRFEVSARTVYRDICDLQAQAIPIRGEAGIGYVLDPGYDLPPLMFTRDEVDAIALGAQWVAARAEPDLARAAADVLAKIRDAMPKRLQGMLVAASVMSGATAVEVAPAAARLRAQIHRHAKVRISYLALDGAASTRVLWPLAVAYFDQAQLLVAWCESRKNFRHFRIDRIVNIEPLDEPIPELREHLLARWEGRRHRQSGRQQG